MEISDQEGSGPPWAVMPLEEEEEEEEEEAEEEEEEEEEEHNIHIWNLYVGTKFRLLCMYVYLVIPIGF